MMVDYKFEAHLNREPPEGGFRSLSDIYIYIRECGSTLYVGLARTAPPTNTNFRLIFLPSPLFTLRVIKPHNA